MSQLKVNTIRHTGASSDAITLASDGTATAKITNNLSNRNLVINGAFQVAQRGTSSTTSGWGTVDRWKHYNSVPDEAVTSTQHVLTSSDTGPWEKGFRYSAHMQNGNQTSGAFGANEVYFYYQFESQDISQSGWNYTSASSYITLSFWVKSSVAQNFYGNLVSRDGTHQAYPFETGSLSANTWTKITKTIPGNSNIQIDNDNEQGLSLAIYAFNGTNYTASGVTLNQWSTKDNAAAVPDMTTTWFTTNDATFEITGVQLEVGDTATDFEHKKYADELRSCMRYYQTFELSMRYNETADTYHLEQPYKVIMRATPTLVRTGNYATGHETGSTCTATSTGVQCHSNSSGPAVGGYGTLSAEL